MYCKMIVEVNNKRIKLSALGVIVSSVMANGFAYFNLMPQHDAINHIFNTAGVWEVRMGRFMQPIYDIIRGELLSPWLVGIISISCLVGIVYIITCLFDIDEPFGILLTAAIFSANITHTEIWSVYPYIEDITMISILLSCISLFIILKESRYRRFSTLFLSLIFMVISIGLYQVSISFTLVMIVLLIIKNIIIHKTIRNDYMRRIYKSTLILVISVILYFLIKAAILQVLDLGEASEGHSIRFFLKNNLGDLFHRVVEVFYSMFNLFFNFTRGSMLRVSKLCNCIISILCVYIIHVVGKENKYSIFDRLIIILLFVLSGGSKCSNVYRN